MNILPSIVRLILKIALFGAGIAGPTLQGTIADWSNAHAAESADVHIGVGMIGGIPEVSGMRLAGQEVNRARADNGMGGGVKVGLFPQWTHRMLGVELEYFGTAGRLSAQTMRSGSVTEGRAGFTVLNSMVNLVLRPPSGGIRPYGGVGVGYSSGMLHDADFSGRANRAFDSTLGFAYQFLGGVQWEVTNKTFLFAEYKYLATAFHWKGLSLDYRANYVVAGLGWSF